MPFGTEYYVERNGAPMLVKKQVVLTGDRLTDAQPGFDNQTSEPAVHLTLDAPARASSSDVTRENVGKRMAILLIEKGKGEVVTAPVIRSEIGGGRVQITGRMTTVEANDVALLLRAGSLAAPMEIIEERTVGPSLGARKHRARASTRRMWGFAAIVVFMIVYYAAVRRDLGRSRSASTCCSWSRCCRMLQATLTLPGIAAIALTLGMAIDANVLINERIREELRNGDTPQAAIHAGYERAFGTILDSNVTTLIAGLALLIFGSGPGARLRGGALPGHPDLDVLARWWCRARMVNLIYGRRRKVEQLVDRQHRLEMSGQDSGPSHGILQDPARHPVHAPCADVQRHLADHVPARGVLPRHQGPALLVEFTGGTVMEVSYTQAGRRRQDPRRARQGSASPTPQVQNFGTSRDVLIRLPLKQGQSQRRRCREKVMEAAAGRRPARRAAARRVRRPAGRQGAGRERRAGAAGRRRSASCSTCALRFEWNFGVAAIIANLHDVVIILGFFAFFQWEFSLPVLAAVLAVLGYSVNESVVVFDRVRENFRKMRKADACRGHRQRHHRHHVAHHHHPRLHADDGAARC